MALGLFPERTFAPEVILFRPGDTLALYSDGFIDARNPDGELLTVDGFGEIVRRYGALPLEPMADRLIESTRAFGSVSDDLTLVLVRFRPT